jgi:16S rRNA (guanine527-N7)-methyltransferase
MSTYRKHGAPPLSLETIAATLAPFRIILSQAQLVSIRDYIDLLVLWNQSVNLTAIEDPVEIVSRHFGESLFAATFLEMWACRLADVGTGAGFPGLALKIAFPDAELTLFESNAKKCAFLAEISQRLSLSRIDIRRQRYGEFEQSGAMFDFVCARALGDYPAFLLWARRVIAPGGRVVLWLGTEESIRLGRRKEFIWDAPVGIPESRRRVILVGRAKP